jgi:hypothetical protein
MEVRMDLSRIVIQELLDHQVIVLRERDGSREFSIVIGTFEALAIDRRVKGIRNQRPLTHDLMSNVLEEVDADLEKIVIHDLRDHTFFAKLVIRHQGRLLEVDSRPSDAIALGVAQNSPLYVDESVLAEVC